MDDLLDARLDRASHHHLARVLRLRRGDSLELVDGRGGCGRFRWNGSPQPERELLQPTSAPPAAPLWLAVAPPRPTRLDWLVEKATELGVDRLVLLDSEHAARAVTPARLERLRRKADEALLQCRRLHRLPIETADTLASLLASCAQAETWFADPPGEACPAEHAAGAPALAAGAPERRSGRPLLVVVGPEGGLSEGEVLQLLAAGARPLTLGPLVLRVETAAMVVAARLLPAGPAPAPGR